jgi:hypothetical protein
MKNPVRIADRAFGNEGTKRTIITCKGSVASLATTHALAILACDPRESVIRPVQQFVHRRFTSYFYYIGQPELLSIKNPSKDQPVPKRYDPEPILAWLGCYGASFG